MWRIRDPKKKQILILDPGVKKAPDPGSATLKLRIRTNMLRIRNIGRSAQTVETTNRLWIRVTDFKNAVLRIHDFLGWIRIQIPGSMPLH